MAVEKLSQTNEQGRRILSLLAKSTNLEGVYRDAAAIKKLDNNHTAFDHFVTFPRELSHAFPGSYISPETFFEHCGGKEYKEKHAVDTILSSATSVDKKPVYKVEKGSEFSLSIWNGAMSPHARTMSRIAHEDPTFADPANRMLYQDAHLKHMLPMLQSKEKGKRGKALRIHDDCLASADSIVGYLALMENTNPDILKHGVEVMIDGPATAQGILFLQAYAKAHNIKLKLDVGYLAFGLSKGKIDKKDNKVHGANYITYPKQLLGRTELKEYRDELQHLAAGDQNIYVVGDMGDAQKGVYEGVIAQMLKEDKYALSRDIVLLNISRTDPHGHHPQRADKLEDITFKPEFPLDVDFARGGYFPAAADRLYNQQYGEANIITLKASRDTIGDEYGAGFGPNPEYGMA